jgi:hypothetical protein
MFSTKNFVFLGFVLCLNIGSCAYTFNDFFTKNTMWFSEDGMIVARAEGQSPSLCYGEMKINGSFEPVCCNFNFNALYVTFRDGTKTQFETTKIETGAFLAKDDAFTLTLETNNTGDPAWDDYSATMVGRAIEENDLDAKLFYWFGFENSDLGITLDWINTKMNGDPPPELNFQRSGTYGGSAFVFSFLEDRKFSFLNASNLSASGTYATSADGMVLTFEKDEIFGQKGKMVAFSTVVVW